MYEKILKKVKIELKQFSSTYATVTQIKPLMVVMPYSNTPIAAQKFQHVSVGLGDTVSIKKINGNYIVEGVIS